MAEFLSAAWLKELDDAARTASELAKVAGDGPFVIEQRVNGGPRGDVAYHVILDDDGARVVTGAAPAPDVTLTTDFATACALHRGEANAQQALVAGRLKVGGDAVQLLHRSDALEALDDVFASVRSTTTGTAEGGSDRR